MKLGRWCKDHKGPLKLVTARAFNKLGSSLWVSNFAKVCFQLYCWENNKVGEDTRHLLMNTSTPQLTLDMIHPQLETFKALLNNHINQSQEVTFCNLIIFIARSWNLLLFSRKKNTSHNCFWIPASQKCWSSQVSLKCLLENWKHILNI